MAYPADPIRLRSRTKTDYVIVSVDKRELDALHEIEDCLRSALRRDKHLEPSILYELAYLERIRARR